MLKVESIDTSGLQRLLGGLREAMIASGKDGDMAQIVLDESRLLAAECGKQVPPHTAGEGKAHIAKSVKIKLAAVGEDFVSPKSGTGKTGVEWLFASSSRLIGVAQESDLRRTAPSELVKVVQQISIGRHGATMDLAFQNRQTSQRVTLYKKITTTKRQRNAVARIIQDRVGRLKASFYQTAEAIGRGKTRIPQWVSKHFPTPKAVTDLSQSGNQLHPQVTFGSHAPGVSKQMIERLVNAAVKNRVEKIKSRLVRIANGYRQDAHDGVRPRKRANEIGGQE